MRILQNGSVGAPAKSSKKTSTSHVGVHFSIDSAHGLSEASIPTGASGISSIGDISSLLALQGPQIDRPKERAIGQGFDVLEALDQLKLDVLSGQVSRHQLQQLGSLVERQREHVADPALMNLLDHIELRARVELAKFEQRAQ